MKQTNLLKNHIIFRIHLIILFITTISGYLSHYLLKEDWSLGDTYNTGIIILIIYTTIFLVSYYAVNIIHFRQISFRYRTTRTKRIILLSSYFLSALVMTYKYSMDFGYLVDEIPIIGSSLMMALLLSIPFYFALEKIKYSSLLFAISLAVLSISLTRFNIVILAILFYVSHAHIIKFKSLMFLLFLFLSYQWFHYDSIFYSFYLPYVSLNFQLD